MIETHLKSCLSFNQFNPGSDIFLPLWVVGKGATKAGFCGTGTQEAPTKAIKDPPWFCGTETQEAPTKAIKSRAA
jgi:hypothetical protein